MRVIAGDQFCITGWPLIPGGRVKGTVINLPDHSYDYSTSPPTSMPSHVEFNTARGEYGYWKQSDGGTLTLISRCNQCGCDTNEDVEGFCSNTCLTMFYKLDDDPGAELS